MSERLATVDGENGERAIDGESVLADVMADFVHGEGAGLPPPMGGVLLVRQQADHGAKLTLPPRLGAEVDPAARDRDAAAAAIGGEDGHAADASDLEGVAGAGEFEIVWSHNSSSFAVAYLSGQMAALRVPPRCVFSRLAGAGTKGVGVPVQQRHLPSLEVCTMSAVVT